MSLFSSLTPVFVAVLCVIIGFIFKNSQKKDKTKPKESSSYGAKVRPWVDEDLQDDTEINSKENGIVHSHNTSGFNYSDTVLLLNEPKCHSCEYYCMSIVVVHGIIPAYVYK